jgi:hypothetical protein
MMIVSKLIPSDMTLFDPITAQNGDSRHERRVPQIRFCRAVNGAGIDMQKPIGSSKLLNDLAATCFDSSKQFGDVPEDELRLIGAAEDYDFELRSHKEVWTHWRGKRKRIVV